MTNAVVTIQKLGHKLNVQPITTDDCDVMMMMKNRRKKRNNEEKN